jgi:hypothetical protein
MSDHCRNCTARGDIDICEKLDCSIHDAWYVVRLKLETGFLTDLIGDHISLEDEARDE